MELPPQINPTAWRLKRKQQQQKSLLSPKKRKCTRGNAYENDNLQSALENTSKAGVFK